MTNVKKQDATSDTTGLYFDDLITAQSLGNPIDTTLRAGFVTASRCIMISRLCAEYEAVRNPKTEETIARVV